MQRRPRQGPVARQLAGFKAGGIHAAPDDSVQAAGDAILSKMRHLKRFVRTQRVDGAKRGAKDEWVAGYNRLRKEQERTERELEVLMRSIAEQRGGIHAAAFAGCLREAATSESSVRALAADVRDDVRAASRVARMVLDVVARAGAGCVTSGGEVEVGGRTPPREGFRVGGDDGHQQRAADVAMVRDEFKTRAGETARRLAALEEEEATAVASNDAGESIGRDHLALDGHGDDDDVHAVAERKTPAGRPRSAGPLPETTTAGAPEEPKEAADGDGATHSPGREDALVLPPDDAFEATLRRFASAEPETLIAARRAFDEMVHGFATRRRRLDAAEAAARVQDAPDGATPIPGEWFGRGGWTASEHDAFVRMLAEAERSAGGKGTAAVLEALAVRLPSRTRDELREHLGWTAGRRRYARETRAARDGEARAKGELLRRLEHELAASAAHGARKAAGAAAALSQEATRRRLHDRLARERADRSAAAEKEAFVLEAERFAAAAAEAAREARHLAERLVSKARAEVRREEQSVAAEEAERAAAVAEAARARAREAEAAANRLRVDFRRQEEARKAEERRVREEAALLEEEDRERRLARLRESVAPVGITRDPQRAIAATAASAASDGALALVAETAEAAFGGRVHGYTTDHLMKDQRFRMSEALRDAGMGGTVHGARAMAAAAPYRPPRPDAMTTNERRGRSGSAFG